MSIPIIAGDHEDSILVEQQLYYNERGAHDEDRFFRRGRWDKGPHFNRRWFAEVLEVVQALTEFAPRGSVLELAVGAGIWTKHLVASADQCTVLDSSQSALDGVSARLAQYGSRMNFIHADIFRWTPPTRYDVIFFGFWLTHVPSNLFAPFWGLIDAALKPGGRVFFVDSADPSKSLVGYGPVDPQMHVQSRPMKDGRTARVYKVNYTPEQLVAALDQLGWSVTVKTTATHFLYGHGSLSLPKG